jgi:ABC-type transport system involved in multi-copper enzyme maturation permease subunit
MAAATKEVTKSIAVSGARSPVLLIARKEILDHLLSLKFYICLVMLAALVGLSSFVMYRDYQLRMENYTVLRQRAQPRPGESDLLAVVPPRPLSIFAKGLEDIMDRGYTVTSYHGIGAESRQTPGKNLFILFAAPDLLYIVKVLLSLIALLFAYDAVTGEKEKGTLKIMLSSALSRGQVVTGKMLGGLAVVFVPFLVVFMMALLVLVTRPTIAVGALELSRLSLMVLATLLYVVIFYALGVLVSARARSSASALVVLLFLWAVIVFAVPNAGNLMAEQFTPIPSAETQEMRRHQEFAKNRFISIQSRQRDPAGSLQAFNREYDRLVEDYRAKLDRLVTTSKAICRLSPAAIVGYVFTDLAGTGLVEQRRLSRALMDYKSRNMEALLRQNQPGAPAPTTFEFPQLSLGTVFEQGTLSDFALLILISGGVFVTAVFSFLKTDPR